jgi:hypothetical protein
MPPDQRVRLHDRQHGPPVDQMGEHHERDPRRIIGPARLDLAFSVKCQLLPEKEILCGQLRPQSEPANANLTTSPSTRTAVRHTLDRDTCFRMRQRATILRVGSLTADSIPKSRKISVQTEYLRITGHTSRRRSGSSSYSRPSRGSRSRRTTCCVGGCGRLASRQGFRARHGSRFGGPTRRGHTIKAYPQKSWPRSWVT